MTAFDTAWDLLKIVPDLTTSESSWRDRYRDITGEESNRATIPEGLFISNQPNEGNILLHLPNIAMGTSFNMIDDADKIEDMKGFEEMLAASKDTSHPLFEERFIKDFIRNHNHEFGHALTLEDVINWKLTNRNRDLTRGWESLAHIFQDPHDRDWREQMRWHTEVGDY